MHANEDGRIVIIGAGVAGLICAIDLQRSGRDVVVLEREPSVGGRVRSAHVDGYTVDCGFQVLFTAYPTLRRYLDIDALAPRRFLPGARISVPGRSPALIGDAMAATLRDPAAGARMAFEALFGGALPAPDALHLLGLRHLARSLSVDDCFAPQFDRLTAKELLIERGLSDVAIARFFAPFYGGVLLDPHLGASASMLLFTFKMLAEGDTVVPASGMGALTAQLASTLRDGTMRTSAPVERITRDDDGVTGVHLATGERIEAADVVLATDAPAALRLASNIGIRLSTPGPALGCATVWLASQTPVLPGRAIWLDAPQPRTDTVLHAVTMSDVAPEYVHEHARAGRHLIAATAVGEVATRDDARLLAVAIESVRRMGGHADATLTPVAVERVPYSQFAQPPGSSERRTNAVTSLAGLWRASETSHSSSLDGAARGGVLAAAAIRSRVAVA